MKSHVKREAKQLADRWYYESLTQAINAANLQPWLGVSAASNNYQRVCIPESCKK